MSAKVREPTARKLQGDGPGGSRGLLEDALRVTAVLDLKLADHERHRESIRTVEIVVMSWSSTSQGVGSTSESRQ